MKIIIIGSKGFIGSQVADHLGKNTNNQVWDCDVVTDYTHPRYFLLDASNSDYKEIFQSQKFDYCINCSGAASVPASMQDPLRDYLLNSVNVFKMLDAIRASNPECRFVNLSSAAVYGSPEKLPIDENSPLRPISPYGIHKNMAEDICKEFYSAFNIESCSLRIFSAYGAGLKKQLFWDVYQKSLGKQQIELFGTGNESRDFVHVYDIAKSIELIIGQDKYFNASAINIAAGIECAIKDVVQVFLDALEWKGEITFIGTTRKGDPNNWCADITRLSELGFEPSMNINAGLAQYANWVKDLD